MKSIAAIITACVLLTACQTSEPPKTASGRAEVTVKEPVSKVKSRIISQCMNAGFRVTRDTEYMLQVEKPSQNIAASLLLGSRYDSTPNERIVFNSAQIDKEVRVVGDLMFVTNPGSAFERLTPIESGPAVQELQTVLDRIKYQAIGDTMVEPSHSEKSKSKKRKS